MSPYEFDHTIPRRRFLEWGVKGGFALAASPSLLPSILRGQTPVEAVGPVPDRATLDRVLAKALHRGGDFADVYLERRVSRAINMEGGKFKSAVFGVSRGAGVRVLAGGRTGYAYSDETSEDKLLRAAETASAIARGSGPVRPAPLVPAKRPSFVSVKVPLQSAADERRIEIVRRAHDAALAYDGRIKTAWVDYSDEVRSRTIATSEGLWLESELPHVFFVVRALGSGAKGSRMGRERLARRSGLEVFDEVPPEAVARACARESIAMLDAGEAPAGVMDVVVQNGWGGVLVHEAVGHPLEADSITDGSSVFAGKLGRLVAHPKFTLVDDGTIPNARGTIDFDDEGTPAARNVLIEKGVLLKYMNDALSAKRLKTARTGNGRRESFRYFPLPRMTNTFIAAGTDKPADILASTKSGLFVQSLSGGIVNPTSGTFEFTCREAYLIEAGRKTAPVNGASLTGSCLDVIKNMDAVGDDLDFGPGICGKGQSAEVTVGQPTVRIRGLNVGGTRARG